MFSKHPHRVYFLQIEKYLFHLSMAFGTHARTHTRTIPPFCETHSVARIDRPSRELQEEKKKTPRKTHNSARPDFSHVFQASFLLLDAIPRVNSMVYSSRKQCSYTENVQFFFSRSRVNNKKKRLNVCVRKYIIRALYCHFRAHIDFMNIRNRKKEKYMHAKYGFGCAVSLVLSLSLARVLCVVTCKLEKSPADYFAADILLAQLANAEPR